MGTRRTYARVSAVVCLFVAALWVYQWYFSAGRTALRFARHAYGGRVDEAEAMILPEDRYRLPESYWRELHANDYGSHTAITITGVYIPLLNNELPFWLDQPDGTPRDDRVMYIADGRIIRVGTNSLQD